MYHGTIIILRNDGREDITDSYDGDSYVFPAGKDVTLPELTAKFFKARHGRELTVVSETSGTLGGDAETVALVNVGDTVLVSSYDGIPYTFAPGAPTFVPKVLAPWFMDRPDFMGKLKVDMSAHEAPAQEPAPETPDVPTIGYLAQELGMKVKDLLPIAKSLGIEAQSGKTPLSADEAAQITGVVKNNTDEETH